MKIKLSVIKNRTSLFALQFLIVFLYLSCGDTRISSYDKIDGNVEFVSSDKYREKFSRNNLKNDLIKTSVVSLQNISPCKEGINLKSELSGFKNPFVSGDYVTASDRLEKFVSKLECLDRSTLINHVDKGIADEISKAVKGVKKSKTIDKEFSACNTFNALVNPALLTMDIILYSGKSSIYKALQKNINIGKQCAFYYPKVSFGIWAHDPTTNEFVRQTIFCKEGQSKTCWAITDYLWNYAFDPKNYGVGCYLAEWMENGFVCSRGVNLSNKGKLIENILSRDGKSLSTNDVTNKYRSPLGVSGTDIVKNMDIKCNNSVNAKNSQSKLDEVDIFVFQNKKTNTKNNGSKFGLKLFSPNNSSGEGVPGSGQADAGSQSYLEEMLNATNFNKICPFMAGGPWKEAGKKTIRGYRCGSDYLPFGSSSNSYTYGSGNIIDNGSGSGHDSGGTTLSGDSIGTTPGDGGGGGFSSCPARFNGSGSGYSGPIIGYAAGQHIGSRPGCGGGTMSECSGDCDSAAVEANENLEGKKAEILESCTAAGSGCSGADVDAAVAVAGESDANNSRIDESLSENSGNLEAVSWVDGDGNYGATYDDTSANDVGTHEHEQLHMIYDMLGIDSGSTTGTSQHHEGIRHVQGSGSGGSSYDPEGGSTDCTGRGNQMNSMCGLGLDMGWKPSETMGESATPCYADAPGCEKSGPSAPTSGYSGPTTKDPTGGMGGDTWDSESPGGGEGVPCAVGMFGDGLGAIDCEMFNPGDSISTGSNTSTCNRGSVVDIAKASSQTQVAEVAEDDRCSAVASEMECSGAGMGSPRVISATAASKSLKDIKKTTTMMKQ